MLHNHFTVYRWIKATFWGWLLGVIFILMLSSFLDSIGIEHMQFYLGVGIGAGVGVTQWILLQKTSIIKTKKWIWYSILGMGIPFIILDLALTSDPAYKPVLGVSLGALTLGLLQYSMLKNYTAKAWLWIFGCFAGWSLATLIAFSINYTMPLAGQISALLLAFINLGLILAGGIVLGIITGIVIKKILANSKHSSNYGVNGH
jgi:hypothetical protein